MLEPIDAWDEVFICLLWQRINKPAMTMNPESSTKAAPATTTTGVACRITVADDKGVNAMASM